MIPVFASLIPVFLLIATGWAGRVTGVLDEKHWAGLEKATYLIFFPASNSEPEDLSSSTASLTKTNPAKRRDPLIVGTLTFVSLFIVAVVSIILVFRHPESTQTWADILGTMMVGGDFSDSELVDQMLTFLAAGVCIPFAL